MLHRRTDGLVELAAGTRRDGRLLITTRRRADHFLPGGRAGGERWREALLELAARHADRGEEVFLAPAARSRARGESTRSARAAVCGSTSTSPASCTRCGRSSPSGPATCWSARAARAAPTPTGSSTEPLPATRVDEATGEVVEPIERANLRLVHALGVGADGKPNVADPACAERSRVMRLAGTVNGKTGAYARILEADFALPPYSVEQLVGDLPDPATPVAAESRTRRAEPRSVQADQPARVLREARRHRRPARRARVMSGALARGPASVVLGRHKPRAGLVLPCRRLRGARGDLRPGLGAARRTVGPRVARRGVQARPRLRRRRVRRAVTTNHNQRRRRR